MEASVCLSMGLSVHPSGPCSAAPGPDLHLSEGDGELKAFPVVPVNSLQEEGKEKG